MGDSHKMWPNWALGQGMEVVSPQDSLVKPVAHVGRTAI